MKDYKSFENNGRHKNSMDMMVQAMILFVGLSVSPTLHGCCFAPRHLNRWPTSRVAIMKILRFTILLLLLTANVTFAFGQTQSKTYSETRKLLLEMERARADETLKKLFEEGEARRFDLIQALYDSDQKVSLNAQSVIKYLADPKVLSSLEDWFQYRKKNAPDYWESPVQLLKEIKYLNGDDKDLEKLILKNLFSDSKDTWAKQFAFNKTSETVLIEVVSGSTGWHVVIRRENGKWRLLSHYLVWQS